ncbi:hypothetical protein SteCoe_16513 [Stentor coeruleus]|uniref:Uncharacterized protein n=1 Tax=Stentor coeruleus TaxID=5963 RepID=A0A1R2C118_9CILI|nr:hypothetical protein SteCoe_16513 [Stentor coeruleus]
MKKNSRCTPLPPSRSVSSLSKKDYGPVRPFSSLACIECEKQHESIEQLKYMLYSTEEKLTLTEKHIKLYEKVMEYKDNQTNDSSMSLIRERHLLAEEKRKILNLLTKAEEEKAIIRAEKESLAKQRSKTFYELGNFECKKNELEKSIYHYNKERESLEPPEELASFHMENFMTTEESQFQRLLGESNDSSDEFENENSYTPFKPRESYFSMPKKTREKEFEIRENKKKLQETQEHFDKNQSKSLQNIEIAARSLKSHEKSLSIEKLQVPESQRHLSHEFSSHGKLKKPIKSPDYSDKTPQTTSRTSFLGLSDKKYRMSADNSKNVLNTNPKIKPGECAFNNIFSVCDTDISLNKKRKNPSGLYGKSEQDTSDNYQCLVNELENTRVENEILKHHLEKYKEKCENIERQLENAQNDYSKTRKILDNKERELDAVIVELNTLKGNWKNTLYELKQAKIEISTTKQALRAAKTQGSSQAGIEIFGLKDQIVTASNEIMNLKNIIDRKNKEIEENHNDICALKSEAEFKNTEILHAQHKLLSQESDNNSLKIERNLLQSELLSRKSKILALKQELTQTKKEISNFNIEKSDKKRASEPVIVLKNEQELNTKKINNLIAEKEQLIQKVLELERLYKEEKDKILEEKVGIAEILEEKKMYFNEMSKIKKLYEEEKDKVARILQDYEELRQKNVLLLDEILLARDCENIYQEEKRNTEHFTINMWHSAIFNTNNNTENQKTHNISQYKSEIAELKQQLNAQDFILKQKSFCKNCITLEDNLNTLKADYENLLQTLKTKTTEFENLKHQFEVQNSKFSLSSKPSLSITLEFSNQIKSSYPIKPQLQNNILNPLISSSPLESQEFLHPQEPIPENSSLQNSIISLKLSEISLKSEIKSLQNELLFTKSLLSQETAEFIISINPIIQSSDETNKHIQQKSSSKVLVLESELEDTCTQLFTARNELMSCQAELMTANSELIRTKGDLEMAIILIDSYKSEKGENTEILKLTNTLNSYKNQNSALMLKINELQNYITRESQRYKQELEKSLELQDKREKENLQLMIQLESSIKTQKYQSMLEKKVDIDEINEDDQDNQDLETQNELLKRSVKMLENQLSELYANHQKSRNEAEMYRTLSESLHTQLHVGDISESSDISDSDESIVKSKNEKISSEIESLRTELEEKLGKLRVKEKEVKEISDKLLKERYDVKQDAEYVKKLTQELEIVKTEVHGEKELVLSEKMRIAALNKKLEEKNCMISKREQEILMFKEQLEERERLVKIKERNLNSWALDPE